MKISTVFGPFNMSLMQRSSEAKLFRYLSNYFFRSPSFRKYISYKAHLLFGKEVAFRFQQCLRPFTMKLVEWSSETGLFGHFSNHVFPRLNFQKYKSYEGHLFIENIQNFICISNMHKNSEKKLFLGYVYLNWLR